MVKNLSGQSAAEKNAAVRRASLRHSCYDVDMLHFPSPDEAVENRRKRAGRETKELGENWLENPLKWEAYQSNAKGFKKFWRGLFSGRLYKKCVNFL